MSISIDNMLDMYDEYDTYIGEDNRKRVVVIENGRKVSVLYDHYHSQNELDDAYYVLEENDIELQFTNRKPVTMYIKKTRAKKTDASNFTSEIKPKKRQHISRSPRSAPLRSIAHPAIPNTRKMLVK